MKLPEKRLLEREEQVSENKLLVASDQLIARDLPINLSGTKRLWEAKAGKKTCAAALPESALRTRLS